MRISVEEEYGLRLWHWDYPGTEEELIADWKALRGPFNFFDPSKMPPGSRGVLTLANGHLKTINDPRVELTDDELDAFYKNEFFVHTHMLDDTTLTIRATHYDHPRKHVRDADE